MKAAVVMVRNRQDQIDNQVRGWGVAQGRTNQTYKDRQTGGLHENTPTPLPHLLLRKSDLKDSTLGRAARVQMAHCLWIFCPRLQLIWMEMSEKRAHVPECSLASCCSPNTMRLFTQHQVFYAI